MNICMVLDSNFPPDIRVEKEARALISAGHKIYLLSLGKDGMPAIENINGITVIRVFPAESFLNRVWRFLWFNAFFDNPLWKRSLKDIIKQHKIEIIHVHDLPMVKTAASVAKKFNIPIIADLHENYPEGIRAWSKVKMTLYFRPRQIELFQSSETSV